MSIRNRQPVYFGQARQLFGWLHHVRSSTPANMGLVLCNPFGYEAVCAHRAMRHLAESAVDLRIPSLRFDYEGTGDSSGDEFDPNQVTTWITNIHAACEALKNATGVTSVCLLGIRLGALLVTRVASERNDVVGVAAIAPVVKGKTYLRELRALQSTLAAQDRNSTHNDATLESAGFVMNAQTVLDIGTLEAGTLSDQRVLILDRADLPTARAWSEALTLGGNRVEYHTTNDHELLAAPPHSLPLPTHILDVTRNWLMSLLATVARDAYPGKEQPAEMQAVEPATTTELRVDASLSVTESAYFLGSEASPFAIVTEASATSRQRPPQAKRAVLLLNAGATHHIGAGRLYVTVARRLATQGYIVMRLDLVGLGDSPVPDGVHENIVYCSHASRDIKHAIEVLQQRYGCTDIAAVGLCAGAYHSFKLALEQAPLRSIVLINPLTFYWQEGLSLATDFSAEEAAAITERYARNMLQLKTWKKLFAGRAAARKLLRVASRRIGNAITVTKRDLARLLGTSVTEDLAADLRQIVRGGTRVTFIFADHDLGLQRLRLQGGAAVARLIRKRHIALHLIADADHTFTQAQHRDQVLKLIMLLAQEP